MYQPEVYGVVLGFMITSMLCWGSWANTLKLCPGFRFQLFYWDYVLGLIVASCLWGFTLGSMGTAGQPFLTDVSNAASKSILLAMVGGAVFNVANLLLVAAIDIAGLAVAFPIGIGLALVIGAISNYVISPKGNPLLLFGGIAMVVAAILFDAIAYRKREQTRAAMSRRGIIISLVAGVLMGCFYPFVSAAMTGNRPLGPYASVLYFSIGVAISAIPFNWILMRKPLDGSKPTSMSEYARTGLGPHFWGVLGGIIWCTGALFNFISSNAHLVGPAVSYSIGQGATMVSAAWGVFIWREFSAAPAIARRFIAWMFFLFLAGLTSIALAPLY
ncbi:MAG TPA: GRP family sugar transporter [Terracidiphilus sp.]